jgi:hypothetical protein
MRFGSFKAHGSPTSARVYWSGRCADTGVRGVEQGKLRVGDGDGLLVRARAFAQRADWSTADAQLHAVLELAEQAGDEHLAMRALVVAALVHAGRGELTEACECLNKVIQVRLTY